MTIISGEAAWINLGGNFRMNAGDFFAELKRQTAGKAGLADAVVPAR